MRTMRRVRALLERTRRRATVPVIALLALFVSRGAIVEALARIELMSGLSRSTHYVLFALFAGTNLVVLIFALKPSRGLALHARSSVRSRIARDMDDEQAQMPEVVNVLGRAFGDTQQRRALRHLALFFVPLFLLPLWWSVFLERRTALAAQDACARAMLTAQAMMGWLFGNDVSACSGFGGTLGKIVGGAVLFMGAVFFRSRVQIALRGFSRYQRRG